MSLTYGYGIIGSRVYVIYTNDGPYDTFETYELAKEFAEKIYCLKDYKIIAEKIFVE